MDQTASDGWAIVADNEGAAALIGAIIQLDASDSYTRSELADAADVPLKELYLSETLADLAEIGLLEPVPEAEEATYVIDDTSAVYEQAAAFDRAATDHRETQSREA